MKTLRTHLRIFASGAALALILMWTIRPVDAGREKSVANASIGSLLQEASAPPVTCVDRPKGIKAPPKRLAPEPRPRKKERDDDDRDEAKTSGQLRTSRLGFKPVCQQGKVPVFKMIPDKVAKGNPLLAPDPEREYLRYQGRELEEFVRRHVRAFAEVYKRSSGPDDPPGCDGVAWFGSCYYYGSAAFSTTADGGGMTNSIDNPAYVNTGGSGHTLDEIAVQGGANNGNIVELGWLVSSDQEGNNNPHIFVFHWKNWAGTCYDGCGWQQWSNTYHPGMDIGTAVGKQVYIGYVFYQGNWWAWFDDQWMGYFPGSEWNGQYTKTSLIQWFGEVASANGIPPQTNMGDGQLPAATSAATMTTLCDVDAKAWVCWYRDQQSLSRTVAKYYDISRVAFGATRYGGPGQ